MAKSLTKQEMLNWFRKRYELANETLFHAEKDSKEPFEYPPGSGGPVDVKVAIREQFPGADSTDIDCVVRKLEDLGEWTDLKSYDEINSEIEVAE